tara:strand:- start:96 stop:974 length:879 start_codon:yes stop_codon:yes gene_type:complete
VKSLFPRKKPIPVPKITVTPEYLAKGKLKKSYTSTKLAFNVPWMGVVAMAFAKYPNFYYALWKYIHPLSKSIEFNNLCKKLVNISKRKAIELKPKSIIKDLKKIGYNNYEIKKIYKVNHIFIIGNMPYLIMATLARVLLEKGELLNRNSYNKNINNKISSNESYLLLMEQHHADNSLKEVFKSIKYNIGLPFINTDYRAFARWPSYFITAWKSLLPTLLSKKYEKNVLEIHNFIIKEVLSLPNPNKITSVQIITAAKKDKKINEIKKVVNLFQWLLPGLITNVAFMREQIKK